MAFTEKLSYRKPRTAAEAYNEWFAGLPATERDAVAEALRDRSRWSNPELKPILEGDEDYPAPPFGDTAFRSWRSEFTA